MTVNMHTYCTTDRRHETRRVDLRSAVLEWFRAKGLDQALNEDRIAALGEHRATYYKIMRGDTQKMQIDTVARILKKIGGDLDRALPGYDATPEIARLEKLKAALDKKSAKLGLTEQWIGEVSAGDGRVVLIETEEHETAPSQSNLDRLARQHRAYQYGDGPIMLLAVRGDSMEPEYPDGCTILVRAVADAKDLPNRTDVLIQDHRHDLTNFKRLVWDRSGKGIIALPLNDTYDPEFYGPNEADVTHVVVGKIVT